jgi:2Fe-2S ferredoxin
MVGHFVQRQPQALTPDQYVRTFDVCITIIPPEPEQMTKITFIGHGGDVYEVEARDGLSVMEAATKNNVPGIDADCGGACACATCHVYLVEPWLARLDVVSAMEESMLEFANNAEPNSRLSCQIKVSPALDGLTVRLPESQH